MAILFGCGPESRLLEQENDEGALPGEPAGNAEVVLVGRILRNDRVGREKRGRTSTARYSFTELLFKLRMYCGVRPAALNLRFSTTPIRGR